MLKLLPFWPSALSISAEHVTSPEFFLGSCWHLAADAVCASRVVFTTLTRTFHITALVHSHTYRWHNYIWTQRLKFNGLMLQNNLISALCARVRFQTSRYRICGGWSGTGTAFLRIFRFTRAYNSMVLSSTTDAVNLGNWQRFRLSNTVFLMYVGKSHTVYARVGQFSGIFRCWKHGPLICFRGISISPRVDITDLQIDTSLQVGYTVVLHGIHP